MKIALDFHGVVDRNPRFFVAAADTIHKKGGEVIILTGMSNKGTDLEERLLDFNSGCKWWDEIVSITDTLIDSEEEYYLDSFNRPFFEATIWNLFKGEYCRKNDVDLLIDDKKEYFKGMEEGKYLLHEGSVLKCMEVLSKI
jgi:hypothetical protein